MRHERVEGEGERGEKRKASQKKKASRMEEEEKGRGGLKRVKISPNTERKVVGAASDASPGWI